MDADDACPAAAAAIATASVSPATPWRTVLRRFWRLAGGYWRERAAWALALGLLALNATEVWLLLRLAQWHRDLFDALERRDGPTVLAEAGVLLALVAAFAALSFLHLRTRRRMALGWRAWVGARLSAAWLAAGGPAAGGAANADGRIAEDARIATEEAVELASSFSHAIMTLTCFVGLLWALSAHPPIALGGVVFDVPGYLLWIAALYAGGGAAVAALLGRPLVRSTDHRQGREADYRAALVRVLDEGRHGRAPGHAEGGRLAGLFAEVAGAFRRQTTAFAHLQLFCVGNTRLGGGLPYLVATPAYLAGVVTLGWVMQAAQAFTQVATALNWPVDHMPRIATWRASAERVVALQEAVAVAAGPAPQEADPVGALLAAGSGRSAGVAEAAARAAV